MATRSPTEDPAPRGADECLDDEALAHMLDGRSGTAAVDAALAHASWCEACRSLIAMVARLRAAERDADAVSVPDDASTLPPHAPEAASALRAGDQVGRFVLERAVGQGGMGVVFCANDTTLQRRVAIKFLHAGGARARLLREARAMARIDHPNVVRVYETSTAGELSYIVMEFVDGMDLRHWLRAAPRSWIDVVRTYAAAGRGLAAAHAHGLVHRDFKPHNVLVADDPAVPHALPRVLVTDFGLARAVDAARADDGPRTAGTPRYMAPEQQDASEVGSAADQFAFCTALREALFDPRELPVPPALLEVLRRGTQRRPEDRFATMDTLVAELERIADAPRRRKQLALGALALVVVSTIGFGFGVGSRVDERPCAEPEGGDFAGIWDDARKAGVRTALESPAAGADAWTRVSGIVDAYTERWSVLRREACEATRVRSEVSEAILDRRMACLGRGKSALAATVDLVEAGHAESIRHAVDLAHALPPVESCAEIVQLEDGPPRPTDATTVARLEAAERELAVVRALVVTGEAEEAARRGATLLDEARAIGWPLLLAEVLVAVARAQSDVDVTGACETARQAYRAAVLTGSDDTAYEAALGAGARYAFAGRIDEAELFFGLAEAHIERIGGEPVPGSLAATRAGLERRRGNMEAALALLEEAYALTIADPQREHDVATLLGDIGGTLHELGRSADAMAATEQAIEASTAAFGHDHHRTLFLRANRALLRYNLGAFVEAEAELQTVLALQRSSGPPLTIATSLTMLAATLRAQGRWAEAFAADSEALALREAAVGEDHPMLAESLSKLATDAVALGDTEAAIADLHRAIAIARAQPIDHHLLDLHAELAFAHQQAGDPQAALAAVEAALDVREQAALEDRRGVPFEYRYGVVLGLVGRHAEAARVLEHAAALVRTGGVDHRTEAFVHYHLGRSLWETGERERGRAEVEHARALLVEHDDRDHDTWPDIERWLADH